MSTGEQTSLYGALLRTVQYPRRAHDIPGSCTITSTSPPAVWHSREAPYLKRCCLRHAPQTCDKSPGPCPMTLFMRRCKCMIIFSDHQRVVDCGKMAFSEVFQKLVGNPSRLQGDFAINACSLDVVCCFRTRPTGHVAGYQMIERGTDDAHQ